MSQLFPSEIIKNSTENYVSELRTSDRIIYMSVILFLLVAFGTLPFLTVQVTTQSQGVIRSGNEDNSVTTVVSGEVLSCKITENQSVNKGDTLLVVSTDRLDEEIRFSFAQQNEESRIINDLNSLLYTDNGTIHSQTNETNMPESSTKASINILHSTILNDLMSPVLHQDYLLYSGKLEEQRTQLLLAESEYKLAETLFNKGITPKHDFEKISHQFQFEKTRYSTIQAQQFTQWQEKLKQSKMRFEDLSAKIKQLRTEKKQYYLTAPISGTIADFTGIKGGNFILPNQQIARITPESDLLVECLISPSDIGLIEKDMSASFQLHAFNYNLWGSATGKVNEISNNVVTINNHPFFKIKCQLDQSFLQLKNGHRGNLKKGMTLTGRFKISERTLFQLLYDKADDWLNPKHING